MAHKKNDAHLILSHVGSEIHDALSNAGEGGMARNMEDRKTYSVHELAELSGCTVRTLHHYDDLGLICPKRADNGYRCYGRIEVERLQQVLLYRECGMPLADIKRLMDDPSFNAYEALVGHVHDLRMQRKHIDGLIASVEKTLACLKGEITMKDEERFEALKRDLVEENERTYGAEVRQRWGDQTADDSNKKVMDMTEGEYKGVQGLEAQIKDALVAGIEEGDPAGESGQRAADLHRQWLCAYWPDGMYSKETHIGLAESYVADERFKAYYEAMAPGAAEFLRDAVRIYCA